MAALIGIQCKSCGETFSGESAFSQHRDGYGKCLHPGQLGMKLAAVGGCQVAVWRLDDDDCQIHD